MKFKCHDCNEEWIIPKEEFIYIRNWPDTCPNCESVNINHGIVEKVVTSSGALETGKDIELEEIKRKKLEKMLQDVKKRGGDRMKARIVVPVLDESGYNARLSEHFGRAPYFAVVDLDENGCISSQRTVPNTSEHFGGTGRPPDRILQLRPNALITYGMGPRALNIFQNARVPVLRANANTVKDVIAAYNNDALEELTEGCRHAHHQ
jgi:predicted Fe-Mo cluster-binding NifX family protein/Zn-finger nucleic acid-binding protein